MTTSKRPECGEALRRCRVATGPTRQAQWELAGLGTRGVPDLEPGVRPAPYLNTLHTGEADLRSSDFCGTDVNRCARLQAIARGGQLVLSAVTAANFAREAFRPEVESRALGVYR